MGFITAAAIKRRSVTLLAVAIVLVAGVFTYNSLRVELFPEIDFPLVVVTTSYPLQTRKVSCRMLPPP